MTSSAEPLATVMQDPEGNEFCVTSSLTLPGWT